MAPSRRKGASKAAAAAAARRQWKIGDLVLAKVKGFPAWPATVSEPEKWGYSADWKKVLVHFFGTQQIAFCNPADVEPFTEEKKQSLLGKRHGKGADFVRAVREIIASYDNMKKQDQSNDANTTDGHTLVTENNSTELSAKPFGEGDAPEGQTHCADVEDHMNDKSGTSATVHGKDGLKDQFRPDNEDKSSLIGTEMTSENVDSSRENSERTETLKCFTRRRPPSARRARSASRTDTNKLQTRSTRSGTVAPSILRDGPGRRNKRIRKSPDDLYGHDRDAPDLVSNVSNEGNDSGILTAGSDSPSLNEGSTVDSDCKTVTADSSNEHSQKNVELSRRLDFQTNGISKRKRKPNRKRPSCDISAKPDEKTASDADAIKRDQISPGDQEISTDKLPKEDGDEHLPLVKRARVRLGRILSTCEQLQASLDTEEKPLEVCFSVSDQFHVPSDREGDDSTDRKPVSVKEDLEKLLQSDKLHTAKPQAWEVKKYQHLGSSVEGEAALPPSKRLHRALEAMSANAAEERQTTSDVPSTPKVDTTSKSGSPSSNDCLKSSLDREKGDERKAGMREENNCNNNKPPDGASECLVKLDLSITEERTSSVELATCSSDGIGRQKSCEDNVGSLDNKCVSKSPSHDDIANVVVLQSSESLSPKGAHLSGSCSPDLALPLPGDCKTVSPTLLKASENVDHKTNQLEGDNLTMQSPHSSADMEIDSATEECDRVVDSCQLVPDENKPTDEMSKDVGEVGLAMDDSSASLCPVSAEVMSNVTEDQDQSHSNSAANDHVEDKTTPETKSSLSPTYNSETITCAKQQTSSLNMSTSASSSNTSRSPIAHSHRDVQRAAGKWNYKEAHDALMSFEGFLGTLTRTKESIGRATRSAMECAKCGVAAKVVEMLTHSLEREPSLHRRVDLFFLVDSIAQYSKSLKGDAGGVYPSAILAVLPRLLSAAAPPGSNSQENRRQCLKVLRVWQERRILPESIVRQHIRELDLLCGSSCSRTRRLRNERAFDDPIREMEGMLVDEYGSNSSIQLPGFCMPPMLRDEDDGVDSDGEGFEAVTPEHDNEKTEAERNPISAVEKHRHILEDVDGELEMEDVAPQSSEAVISSSDNAATISVPTMYHSVGNAVTLPFAPPLPMDIPPVSPPLPKSPPPPPPPPPLLAPEASFPPPEMPDSLSSTVRPAYVYSQNIEEDFRESSSQQSHAPGVNPKISDGLQSSRAGPLEFQSQVPNHLANPTHCSFNNRPISSPPVRAVNNIPPSDGAYNKGFRLRPPHPAPSNQFSYVQSDHRVQSRRDVPPPSHSTRYHVPNTENGNFYRDADRMKLAPRDTGEHWRAPAFPGPRYPDGSRMPYTPAPYGAHPGEPSVHGNRWGFPPGATNHRMIMPHRPPTGGPIPVAARGPNCWRPR
ncbi:OLC1v1007344C2 [Oldenlandia corymbosa var. corymbosa]|uniref:OLC1v1007344C2 n=1 Tax=Oldenlandia corymbosa var. corymbosa TaxID=529605 RepID=A0AAV1DIZ4_OLDCO|nr:OLC1v1007344C2 [Oldenlandia corymbosa var. corymbosa]